MFVVSWPLALVALGSLAVYAVLRISFYSPLYKRGEDVVRAEANYMTHLIESIRSVQAIKLFNAEGARESQFITRVADAVHGRANQQRLLAVFVALRETRRHARTGRLRVGRRLPRVARRDHHRGAVRDPRLQDPIHRPPESTSSKR